MEILRNLWDKDDKESERKKLRERFDDPNFLPNHDDVTAVFGGERNYRNKDLQKYFEDSEKPGGLSFEILTQEYIHEFGNYLNQRISELKKDSDEPVTILEVGAGNGRLTHFLSQELDSQNVRVIAVDKKTDEWKIEPVFAVEELDYKEALEKYKPQIVISSWMPLGKDWTRDFRNTESVDEYILVGDNEATGLTYESWGDREGELETLELMEKEDTEEYERIRFGPVPFEKDGFESDVLGEITNQQVSRGGHHGVTQSFRRRH